MAISSKAIGSAEFCTWAEEEYHRPLRPSPQTRYHDSDVSGGTYTPPEAIVTL